MLLDVLAWLVAVELVGILAFPAASCFSAGYRTGVIP